MASNTQDNEYLQLHKEIIQRQKKICEKYGVEWYPSPPDMRIGISKNLRSGKVPINGLRHPPEKGTAGWYIWEGGDINNDPNEWDAIHIDHLSEEFPSVLPYLGLPPGWRFQVDDKGYEDVWEDKKLLDV